jgi:hypothetical protein
MREGDWREKNAGLGSRIPRFSPDTYFFLHSVADLWLVTSYLQTLGHPDNAGIRSI